VSHRADGAGLEDLPAEYRRLLLRIVPEDGPIGQGVACKRGTAELGPSESRATEKGYGSSSSGWSRGAGWSRVRRAISPHAHSRMARRGEHSVGRRS
jgi:hypothetical protein